MHVPGRPNDAVMKGGVLVNINATFAPVKTRPWAGAASLGARLPFGEMAVRSIEVHRVAAPSCAVSGVPGQHQVFTSALPGTASGQHSTLTPYTDAIRAAARQGSQTGSLPAWDPV